MRDFCLVSSGGTSRIHRIGLSLGLRLSRGWLSKGWKMSVPEGRGVLPNKRAWGWGLEERTHQGGI